MGRPASVAWHRHAPSGTSMWGGLTAFLCRGQWLILKSRQIGSTVSIALTYCLKPMTRWGLTLLHRHDLSRIHDAVRIERTLDRGHGRERGRTQFTREVFHLALADTVLAGAGAVHGERAFDQPLAQRFRGLEFGRVGHVDQQAEVKIA